MFKWIKEWWNKPSAEQCVLDAMTYHFKDGLTIANEAGLNPAQFWFIAQNLINRGVVKAEWDRSGLHTPGGRKRRMYAKRRV